jgi:hypothetical protein
MATITISLLDGRKLSCPHRLSGQDLLELLDDEPSITLGSITPLKNGEALRAFRFVSQDAESVDLSGYCEIFKSDKSYIGRIINH